MPVTAVDGSHKIKSLRQIDHHWMPRPHIEPSSFISYLDQNRVKREGGGKREERRGKAEGGKMKRGSRLQ